MRSDHRQFALNMGASILAFAVNTGIQFFATPVLTRSVGDEAYGFITIANDFTSYAGIFATILNSVAARFISVETHKKNYEKAEEYYASILFGNFIIAFILCVFAGEIISHFEEFLRVPKGLEADVAKVFTLTFANYILSVLISVFTVAAYVKNRLDLTSVRTVISYLIKLGLMIVLFFFMPSVKVYYIALATLGSTVFLGIANAKMSQRIMPEIRIRIKKFRPGFIGVLLKTGAWMTINNLSNVLANNMTAVIINIYVSAARAGFYSAARAIPNCTNSLAHSLYNIFVPTYLKLYAEDNMEELTAYGINSMKIMSFVLCVPFLVLCVKGRDFIALWQGYRTSGEITEMALILCISVLLTILYTPTLPISQMGLIANNIKWQMLNNIFISAVSLAAVFCVISKTSFGLIGIAAALTGIQGMKWIFFTPFYAAYVIKIPIFTFFKENVRILLCEICLGGILLFFSCFLPGKSWIFLALSVLVLCGIGYFCMFFLLFSKKEKEGMVKKVNALIAGFYQRRTRS